LWNGGDIVQSNTSQTNLEYGSRRKRRTAIKSIHELLVAIRTAEQKYLDNVPVNFRDSEPFEVGENAVDALDEIICLLSEVY